MFYVIHCIDKDGMVDRRLELYDQHKAYLAAADIKTVVSGPLVMENSETMIGSMFIVEADTLAAVEDFNRKDPFNKAGLWGVVNIHGFNKRVDNR